MKRKDLLWSATVAVAVAALAIVNARPNRYGHSDREERHLMPAVSSGPLDPAWSPDGRWIAFFSDRSGEYEVTLKRADGKTFEGADEHAEKRLTTLGPGWKDSLTWSPDSKKLLIGTSAGELHLYDLAAASLVHVHTNPEGFTLDVDWSPDGAWLAWSHRHSESRLSALYLYDVAKAETHEVTSGMFDDGGPTFDRGGDFLYFTSARTFEPLYSDVDGTWVYANARNLCAVPLRKDVVNPFAPENHEEAGDGGPGDKEKEKKEQEEEKAKQEEEDGDKLAEQPVPPVRIDLDGFERRILILPVEAGRISALAGAKDKVVFLQAPRAGAADDDSEAQDGEEAQGRSELCFLDLKAEKEKRKPQTILAGRVQAFELTAKGDKLVVALGDDLGAVDLAPDQTLKSVDLSGLVAVIDPRAEWEQILRDAWRLYRDFFYDPRCTASIGTPWARATRRRWRTPRRARTCTT